MPFGFLSTAPSCYGIRSVAVLLCRRPSYPACRDAVAPPEGALPYAVWLLSVSVARLFRSERRISVSRMMLSRLITHRLCTTLMLGATLGCRPAQLAQ